MHANENESGLTPPADLPIDPAEYWKGESSYDAPPQVECDSSLKRLGPFPLPRGAFPLMGLFATVYEHIAEQARKQQERA